jgi:cytoskeletal protein RodZ
MKKILLSSIIMLGICGIASAQTGSKSSKKQLAGSTSATSTSAAAPTPQKAAVMPASDAAVAPAAVSPDQAASSVAPATPTSADGGTTVNAAGEVVPTDARKQAKMAAAKAANAPKTTGKQQK